MRILVRSDVPGWAYSRRAEAYEKYAPEGWHVRAFDSSQAVNHRRWDGVLLLDCTQSGEDYPNSRVVKMIGSHAWMYERDIHDMRTLGVNKNRRLFNLPNAISGCDVAVYNREQFKFVEGFADKFFEVNPKVTLAPYCVDISVFCPAPNLVQNRKLRIGWNYQVSGGLNSFKGLSQVLIPLIQQLGHNVEFDVLTTDSGSCLSTADLVEWYRSLDVFLCTSSAEGGPQGPFEAAACGCIVVSTDVGQVSDWEWLRNNGLIVPTYKSKEDAMFSVMMMKHTIYDLCRENTNGSLTDLKRTIVSDIRSNWNAETECPKQLKEMFDAG